MTALCALAISWSESSDSSSLYSQSCGAMFLGYLLYIASIVCNSQKGVWNKEYLQYDQWYGLKQVDILTSKNQALYIIYLKHNVYETS